MDYQILRLYCHWCIGFIKKLMQSHSVHLFDSAYIENNSSIKVFDISIGNTHFKKAGRFSFGFFVFTL
jgi:hypothetical protein